MCANQKLPHSALSPQTSALSLRGEMLHDEPMSRHTSWRAGGTAQRMYRPADLADLQLFLQQLPAEEPLLAVGLGSNLLVRDGGFRGTVLLMAGALAELRMEDGLISPQGGGRGCTKGRQSTTQQAACGIDTKAADDKVKQSVTSQRLDGIDTAATTTLYAQAGVPGAKLARFAATNNLCGAEFFVGIPGTLGGMLAMNAGCYGSETWQKVERVQVLTRSGELIERMPGEYEVGYRYVQRMQDVGCGMQESVRREDGVAESSILHPAPCPQEFFVGAWLKLEKGDVEETRQAIKILMEKRSATQPLNLPNAGSVFRNPPGNHAAKLIEGCGLKGKRIGGAEVSEKHANFIVNVGEATAADIENLINEVQATVLQQTGIELHPEVRIVGEMK